MTDQPMPPWFADGRHGPTPGEMAAAVRPAPAEHCGDIAPPLSENGPSDLERECVLRPGHSGSHAASNGMRWIYTAPDPRGPAEQCTARLHEDVWRRCIMPARHTEDHADGSGLRWTEAAAIYPAGFEHTGGTNGWRRELNGCWSLPVDGGVLTAPAGTTEEDRMRLARAWADRPATADTPEGPTT